MQQAWHIFRKDIRYLQREIVFLLTLAAALYWLGAHGVRNGDASDALGLIYAAAAGYTIARLIHAAALPGEDQFWVTRPYRWRSLLAAKLLFILAFVNLPVMMAQAAILIVSGFPAASFLPGILWMQVMVLFCVALPLAVIGTLTTGLVPFIGCILVIGLVGFGYEWFGVVPRSGIPSTMDWLRDSILFIALVILAPPILYLQYKSRRTHVSRLLAAGIALCGAYAFLFVQWQTLFPLQACLSKQAVDVRLMRNPTGKFKLWRGQGGQLQLNVPVMMSGLPEGVEARFEGFRVTLEAPDGRSLKFDNTSLANVQSFGANGFSVDPMKWDLRASMWVSDRQFLAAEQGQTLTVLATSYITLFGNTRERTISLRRTPADVMDGLQCYAGMLNQLECRSPFRWPARLVSQKSGTGRTPLTSLISYSPFPATLDLDPIVRKGSIYYSREPLPEERPVTIEVREPLAYLRRDVEVPDLHLDDR
jgi:hypothetical protein